MRLTVIKKFGLIRVSCFHKNITIITIAPRTTIVSIIFVLNFTQS